jgi:hypothetical protein
MPNSNGEDEHQQAAEQTKRDTHPEPTEKEQQPHQAEAVTQKKTEPSHPNSSHPKIKPEWVTVALTAILTVATIVYVIVTWHLWQASIEQIGIVKMSSEAAKKSADVAQAQLLYSSRPWVSANVQIAGAFTFGDKGANLPLLLTLKNIGHSVATRVSHWEDAIPVNGLNITAALSLQKQNCDARRSRSDNLGFVLFPGEEAKIGSTVGPSRGMLDKTEPMDSGTPKTVIFILVGCVDYQFPLETVHHQTRFAYFIGRQSSVLSPTFVGITPIGIVEGLTLIRLPTRNASGNEVD